MAYVHCMPALVAVLRHRLDNVVEGTLRTPQGDIEFITRGHIVKATNRIYRNAAWKPKAGDLVLVDGDLTQASIIIDHIEPDRMAHADGSAANPHLDAIAALLPKHPPASKDLRVYRAREPTRIRFCATASRRTARGGVQDEIVHAAHDAEGWRIWSVAKDGGAPTAKGIDPAILPILARAAGSGLLTGETEREAERRREIEEREAIHAQRSAAPEPPPFDDCPF